MTSAELDRGIEALRVKLEQLAHGERVAYWQLMDELDQGSPELSRALDAELHRLEGAGALRFVEDKKTAESFIELRAAKKKKTASPPAARKKKAPPKKKAPVKKAAPKKKAPVKKAKSKK